MHLSLKLVAIIVAVIIVSVSGFILYKNHEKEVTGTFDFSIASNEIPNVTGVYLELSGISVFNGSTWSNSSFSYTTNLYEDNLSSPGLLEQVTLPSGNYTLFRLDISSVEVGISSAYRNFSLVTSYSNNPYNITLHGDSSANIIFVFHLNNDLNLSKGSFNPVSSIES